MMRSFSFLIILFLTTSLFAQERQQFKGKLIDVNEEPIQGITIFNANSLDGTVSNADGLFFINVKAADKISIKAIQYEGFQLVINEESLKKELVTIQLTEGVNQLDEVYIVNDLMKVNVIKAENIETGLEGVTAASLPAPAVDRMEYTFSDRVRQPQEYSIRHEAMNQNLPRFNMMNLLGGLANLVIGTTLSQINLDSSPALAEQKEDFDQLVLKNRYSTDFLTDYIQLEEQHLYEFMYYAQDRGLTPQALAQENELTILEFLKEVSTEFKTKKQLPQQLMTEAQDSIAPLKDVILHQN